MNAPSHEMIAAQLKRILSSPAFASSKRLQKFLKFIVEETVADRSDRLKEYTIALGVFDRDDSFDPQTSSIVRVEASRLRGKLNSYYAGEGRNDPLRIEVPAGGYVTHFATVEKHDEAAESPGSVAPPTRSRRRAATVGVAVSLGALIFVIGAAVLSTFDFTFFDRDTITEPLIAEIDSVASVAVLPLRNLSGDPSQEYFSDGLTDALISKLASRNGLRVISLTTSMAYKNVNRPIGEIARELNVDHVVEGSILWSGDRMRMTAQLINARADEHIWTEVYERDVADALTVQNELAERIASSLLSEMAPAANAGAQTGRPVDPASLEAFLRGRFFMNQMTEDGFKKGIEYFKEAIVLSPDYAQAHSGMAACHCLLAGHGFELIKPSEGMPSAKAAVLEALRLDDTLAEPHAFLGIIRLKYEWDWPGAEQAILKSIERNPSYAQARVFYSYYLEVMGRREEAVYHAELAKRLNPMSLRTNMNLGWQYLQAGRLEQARLVFEKMGELDPDFWGFHWGMGQYHLQKKQYELAITAFDWAIDAGGGHAMPLASLGYAYAVSGQTAQARAMLGRLHALSEEGYVSPFNMAIILMGLGETDQVFTALERAYEQRSRSMAWLDVTSEFDELRLDPRFRSLLRRIGFPQSEEL